MDIPQGQRLCMIKILPPSSPAPPWPRARSSEYQMENCQWAIRIRPKVVYNLRTSATAQQKRPDVPKQHLCGGAGEQRWWYQLVLLGFCGRHPVVHMSNSDNASHSKKGTKMTEQRFRIYGRWTFVWRLAKKNAKRASALYPIADEKKLTPLSRLE